MTELERLNKRAEKLRVLNLKHRGEILRLRQLCIEQEKEIARLEGEVKSLTAVTDAGCWGDSAQPKRTDKTSNKGR